MSTRPETPKSKSETTRSPKRGNRRGGAYRNAPSNKKAMESKSEEHIAQGSPVVPLPNAEDVERFVAEVSETVDVCWICAEPVKYYALSECNHRTCHVCALRLRALYKKMECTFCKEKQISIIYTKSPDATFASFHPEDIPLKDSKLGIYFETQEMMEDSLLLLRFNCPEQECDYMAHGWGDLRLHVRATHGKFMCDLCIRFKKVFCHEHILYPPGTLPVHLPSMHVRPSKAASKASVEGGVHPLCEFCRECFFGDDELYVHLRERHEECFVCKRNGLLHKYFSNYEALENHFNTAHHPCTQPDCLARKFVVFDTPIDLKAHMVEDHGADMSSKDKKDARRIQTNFTFEGASGGNQHGRREREPPPTQPPQQQSQSLGNPLGRPPPTTRRRDAFGAALTEPQSQPNNRDNRPNSPPVEFDIAADEKQAALLERLEALAPNPSAAVAAIKAATRSYRSVESNARDLILTVWTVMDSHLEHTASIVNALVDTLDEEEKKQDVLSSWKGFVVERKRQFPEPGPTSMGSDYAGIASGRVLDAKHATSSRSSQSVWNRVAMAASSSTLPPPRVKTRFPALGGTPLAARPVGQRSTPWTNSSAPPPTLRPLHSSTPSRSKAPPKLSTAQFPELPPSSASRTRVPVSGNVSLMNILGSGVPVTNVWSGNNSPASGGTIGPAPQTQSPDDLVSGKNKKKGKQKQTLFTLGSIPT